MVELADDLYQQMAQAPYLVLTGAGISTASGIPDYRDSDGVRRGSAPIMHQDFIASPATRKRYWARAMVGWRGVHQATPNPAHQALAALQGQGLISGVITQNVDGLHDVAGSRNVVELHGNLHRVVCLDCGMRLRRDDVQLLLEEQNPYLQDVHAVLAPDGDAQLAARFLEAFRMPHCPCCGSDLLKPDVVFFGGGVEPEQARAAWKAVEAAPGMLIVGTSLMAYSSFRLCQEMSRQGKRLLAINMGRTRADGLLSIKVTQPCEQVLPQIAQRLVQGSQSST
ncbi:MULTISPECIES: NAD-dependent protein deacetylase [unclassified Pseudomonas]|uniref:NAD-dependent protein deacetylase n=1 Tax=unclassified Pseudomonas TaxID=196821 RepID=UPI0017809614|nr:MULTISPECIES: NAD-dependent protein deacetylase [unclassified Pseudomonas]MBD8594803.1 NAD-dependent protein deacetylase [Pseudomonas sp. CFBP 8758]MBD8624993.1 NAD-dependent protein deacetylase [Pseudomonas sp. CFBP 13727]MBD8827601.1 NAD-dependent protein deacetylase [Pseudomonas sp. CFBP 13602]